MTSAHSKRSTSGGPAFESPHLGVDIESDDQCSEEVAARPVEAEPCGQAAATSKRPFGFTGALDGVVNRFD